MKMRVCARHYHPSGEVMPMQYYLALIALILALFTLLKVIS
ncbi:MAG: hypothetical protein JWM96_905 [Alphaproteobacteria bacterium]|nr:hypothetical protein [Alphaproteobacteria bacterium]